MPNEKEERQAPPAELDRDEVSKARALLRDPAQIAPVDQQKIGTRLSEVLTRAVSGNRRTRSR
jgi:hypothetical protein